MDAATIAALKGFQASRGLTPTGTTDAATWPALLGLPAPAAAPVPAPTPAPNLTGGAAAR
jgi:peptidoglycan hydrolase-like protein with peptidoglycan-binding domain